MKQFASEIYHSVEIGALNEPFRAEDVRKACPEWAYKTYNSFLWKHQTGNGKTSELFIRVAEGLYRTIPQMKVVAKGL